MKILFQNKGGYLETQEVRATRDRTPKPCFHSQGTPKHVQLQKHPSLLSPVWMAPQENVDFQRRHAPYVD